jgi:uncharacterized membrane protein
MLLVLSGLLGIVAGLRAMTAPAAASWAAYLGWIDVTDSFLAFMGYAWTPWILTALAMVELVADQLPSTPSRKVPQQFGARILTGGLGGATLGAAGDLLFGGAVAGVIGAIVGTYGGAAARQSLAGMFGRDLPAALFEDVVAVAGAFLIVWSLA